MLVHSAYLVFQGLYRVLCKDLMRNLNHFRVDPALSLTPVEKEETKHKNKLA